MNEIIPFAVAWENADASLVTFTDWRQRLDGGITFFESRRDDLLATLWHQHDTWEIKLLYRGAAVLEGRLKLTLPWQAPEAGYTLIPGVYYHGNASAPTKEIPRIRLPEEPRFQVSLSAASFPAVLWVDDTGQATGCRISPSGVAGWNGVELDGIARQLHIYAPAKELRRYKLTAFAAPPRLPHRLQTNDVLGISLSIQHCEVKGLNGFFAWFVRDFREVQPYGTHNRPEHSWTETVNAVAEELRTYHLVDRTGAPPVLRNAVLTLDTPPTILPEAPELNTIIGWCSGPVTALPFLKMGGVYRDFALRYLDFLVAEGFGPSGLKRAVFDGLRWIVPEEQGASALHEHVRFYGDFVYYLGRCIRHEYAEGREHPVWRSCLVRHLELFCSLWERERDFGLYWDTGGETLRVRQTGSAAGAFVLLALTEGLRQAPADVRLRRVWSEAAEFYARRVLDSGHATGGPADILMADDSESIAALADAFTQGYEVTGDKLWLEYAVAAANLFRSWVVGYAAPFPPGTPWHGKNVAGGVIANVQNRHVGPGICTNSARFLWELAQYTGESGYRECYENILSAAANCVQMAGAPGVAIGHYADGMRVEAVARGMVSEQVNLTDALSPAGESWRVSACWPATALLLGWYDAPEEVTQKWE